VAKSFSEGYVQLEKGCSDNVDDEEGSALVRKILDVTHLFPQQPPVE
jgi:hypothetical protein